MNFFISSEMFSIFISSPSCNLNSNSNIQKKKRMEKYGYRKRRNEFQSHEFILFCNNDENTGLTVSLFFFYCSIAITLNHEQLGKSIQYDYLSANVLAVCANFNQDLGQNLLKLYNFMVTAMEYFISCITPTTLLLSILTAKLVKTKNLKH